MGFHYYDDADRNLESMLETVKFLDTAEETFADCVTVPVSMPDEVYGFLHECAITEYRGVLFASWYNNHTTELQGRCPIRGKRSYDGGLTWEHEEVICDDPTGKIMFCPPVYGKADGHLYMLINQMVGPDLIHALDCYILNEETDRFELLWSRPVPFKLNTNVIPLPNGKLMIAGRVCELDGFPNTPAVLISDDGKIDTKWRLVKIAENGDLPDGSAFVHPEIWPIIDGDTIWMFCRNDRRRVPIVFRSDDRGETWSSPMAYDIPAVSSKICCGTLTDGRHWWIGNITHSDRRRLALYLTEPGTTRFTKCRILHDSAEPGWDNAVNWHYPAAVEHDGKLYIICTVGCGSWARRGAAVTIVDLK
ncbi:MAG: exo-alpha-sialidase [Clostridia bacterium]|nr:exo-alpha-sialidase [Clostridia bacterium]